MKYYDIQVYTTCFKNFILCPFPLKLFCNDRVYYLKEQFGRNIMNDFVENNFIHECYRATCLVVGYDKSFSLNIFLRDKTRMLEVGHMNYIHPYILPTCLVFCNFISFLWNALESTENKIYSSSFYLRCKKINLLLQYFFIVP